MGIKFLYFFHSETIVSSEGAGKVFSLVASLVMQITLRCTMSKTNSGRVIAIDLKNDADNSKYINGNVDRIIFSFCSHVLEEMECRFNIKNTRNVLCLSE